VSDHESGSEGVSAQVAGPQDNWPITVDGTRYCRPCHDAGHLVVTRDQASRTPYCEFHWNEARSSAKRRYRESIKSRDSALGNMRATSTSIHVSAEGYVVLAPEEAAAMRADLHRWSETVRELAEALRHASGSVPGARRVLSAAEDLSTLSDQMSLRSGSLGAPAETARS